MYTLLDIFFLVFHTLLILFNLFGWIWTKTRRLNLVTLALTALSWFGLGIFYGWGYCPSTDWHWAVRRKLGDTDLPRSYISFLVEEWTGWLPPTDLVNIVTLTLFLLALGCSIYVNLINARANRFGGR